MTYSGILTTDELRKVHKISKKGSCTKYEWKTTPMRVL